MHIKLVAINGRFTHSSLALFYVRNELEEYCPDVHTEILQLTIRDPYYEVMLELSREQPDALFFSAAVWNSDRVEELIADLHSLYPSCLLVVGGPQAEVVGRAVGEDVCTVVSGAIEAVGAAFYADLLQGKMKPRYGGSFFHLVDKRFVSPYRDDDFKTHLRNRNIYYESSRGCPFSCSYCLSSAENGTVHKDLQQVRKELDQIMLHKPSILRFVDRTFNDIPERALALWRLVLEYEGETLFHFEIAPDRFSEEMFDFLADVAPGRFQFEIGIQSTHIPTLDAIRRRIEPQAACATVARLAACNNIHLHADLILGLPFETEESFLRSFTDLFATGAHYIQMGLLKLLPDTMIRNNADEYGYCSCHRPPYPVLSNRWLDAETLQRLYWFAECVEKFCNNRYFPSVWRYLRKNDDDGAAFFMHLTKLSHAYRLFSLAATQKLLCRILAEAVAGREDSTVLRELLIYDWLRCGQRVLPEYLADPDEIPPKILKDRLYRGLPETLPGLYEKKNRNRFFKQSVFYEFSDQCLQELGFSCSNPASLVFLRTREPGLLQLQETALLPAEYF